jgi:hypothetical protein
MGDTLLHFATGLILVVMAAELTRVAWRQWRTGGALLKVALVLLIVEVAGLPIGFHRRSERNRCSRIGICFRQSPPPPPASS